MPAIKIENIFILLVLAPIRGIYSQINQVFLCLLFVIVSPENYNRRRKPSMKSEWLNFERNIFSL